MKLLLVTVSIIAVLSDDGLNSPDDYGALDSVPDDTEGYNSAPDDTEGYNSAPDDTEGYNSVDPEPTLPIQDPINKNNVYPFYSKQTGDIIPRKADTLVMKIEQMLQTMKANLNMKIDMEIQAFIVKLTNTSSCNVSNIGCPEGFFNTTGSSQCYKFYDNTIRNYSNCKKICEADGLDLAEPTNPISLRKYLFETYGRLVGVYLGARGTGTNLQWERSGRQISNNDALWWPGYPINVSNSYCLVLLVNNYTLHIHPNQPYSSFACKPNRPALCEYSLELKIDRMLQTLQANLNTKIDMEIRAFKVKLRNTSSCNVSNIGCPKGFFQTAGSNQCYKFYNDKSHTYSEAKQMCQGEGLDLAEPTNPITLRKYLVETYGIYAPVFLGARGTGTNLRWERSGRQISNTDAAWWPGYPGSKVSAIYCLRLLVSKYDMDRQPNQPYSSYPCKWPQFILCELAAN